MKKSVRLLFLFVALGFAVVNCDGGDDITGGGDIGGGTGGGGTGGDNPSGSLGKLEDTEFVKGGSQIIGIDGAIDNETSTISFGSHPVWVQDYQISTKKFIVKNNTDSRVTLEIIEPAFKDSVFFIRCFSDGINCIKITGTNDLDVYPHKEAEVEVKVIDRPLDDNRSVGDKRDKIRIYSNSRQVGLINLNLNLQPLAEKYLDLSVAETTIDFGEVPIDTKVTKYIEFRDKGDVRDFTFSVDGSKISTLNYDGYASITDGDITTTAWSDDLNGKVNSNVWYPTGQVNRYIFDRSTGSPFYILQVIQAGDDIPVVTECNIYKEKKCLVPIVFYPSKAGDVTGKVVIEAKATSPSRHPDGGSKEYIQTFEINLKGNGI